VTTIYEIDPLNDPRWSALVDVHPSATVFHTRGWMEALRATYGYLPRAFTTSPPEARTISNGLPFCEVRSWLTGVRLVSLPFSDYCGAIGASGDLIEAFGTSTHKGFRYAEIRPQPGDDVPHGFGVSGRFRHHTVDLDGGPRVIFDRFHKSSIARKVRRAEREGLVTTSSTDPAALAEFYRLFVSTRRRHGFPPPSLRWFQNVLTSAGSKTASIEIARQRNSGEAIAALFLLRHGSTVYYKYGASDARHHHLGAMPYLFWNTMQRAADEGFRTLDLGRSDLSSTGLIQFKGRLGATNSEVKYWRSPAPQELVKSEGSGNAWVKSLSSHMPDSLLIWTGSMVYPHLG
jgi:CelD/BcsL family acetyltransferase involved in cellulose biosynthesis